MTPTATSSAIGSVVEYDYEASLTNENPETPVDEDLAKVRWVSTPFPQTLVTWLALGRV